MDWKQITGMVIGVVIGALLLTTLVIPIVSDATTTERTFTNEGYFKMTHYGVDDNLTVTWTYEKPNTITVNDEDVLIGFDVPSSSVTVIADTNFLVRMETDNTGAVYRIYYLASSANATNATVSGEQTASFTFSNGTMNAVLPAGNRSASYTDVYLPDNDGLFVMKKYDTVAMLNSDSEVFALGVSRPNVAGGGTIAYPGTGLGFMGSIDDGVEGWVWRTGGYTTAVSNEEINAPKDDNYLNIYKFESITATVTITETVDEETVDTESAVTYNYLIVPYQVTSELTQHLDTNTITIMSIIPLLITVGLIVGVVGLFVIRRE